MNYTDQRVSDFKWNELCMVVGLEVNAHLNGRAVRIRTRHGRTLPDDRVPVQFMVGENEIAIKPENLRRIPDEAGLQDEDIKARMPEADYNDSLLFMYTKRNSLPTGIDGLEMMCTSSSPPSSLPSSPLPRRRSNNTTTTTTTVPKP